MIPHNEKKCASSYQRAMTAAPATAAQHLRARRGLGPMRCRLDSVGSVVSNASTPTSPSPMGFDLVTPTPSSPVSFFCSDDDDDDDFYFYPSYDASAPVSPLSSPLPSGLPSGLPAAVVDDRATFAAATPTTSSTGHDDVDAQDAASLQWRHVGRDLRGIANQFATSRRSRSHQVKPPPLITFINPLNGI